MVRSILDSSINYPEIKSLDDDDKDYDTPMYEVDIRGIDFTIALGQAKYTFINNNIVYFW